ncbi:hypothetical protein GQX73_g5009 [Xylaria multiplex]|uniref:Uncharacterized protein n=1 Tax=Xylaria multiplex TaxID=323545 RepID=A0A7C8MRG2_9PEZI|nr:hypothetical protein GQX73_g5009 [Xylaria multiplex]
MRLLNVETLQLKSFLNEETRPPYAILSHTWLSDTEEVTFEDLLGYYKAVAQEKLLVATSIPPRARSKKTLPSRVGFKKILPSRARPKKILPSRARSNRIIASRAGFKKILASRAGSKKIQGYCNIVARGRNLKWAWIDTCCIDKRSSAELSEAINSMFKWYRDAKQCYVFLRDVTGSQYDPSFQKSKWFTRGWTLQELIAPKKLSFYNKNWRLIGKMHEDLKLCGVVSSITLIPVAFLRGAPLTDACVAKRMSWASKRQTTRPEDKAYCLLGIFDVNMPLLYGEGSKAFIRLQEEIINHIYDDSILAWGTVNAGTPPLFRQVLDPEAHSSDQGALATSPEDFEDCGDFEKALGFFQAQNNPDFQITTAGVKLGVDIFMGAPYALCKGEACGAMDQDGALLLPRPDAAIRLL